MDMSTEDVVKGLMETLEKNIATHKLFAPKGEYKDLPIDQEVVDKLQACRDKIKAALDEAGATLDIYLDEYLMLSLGDHEVNLESGEVSPRSEFIPDESQMIESETATVVLKRPQEYRS